jgi:hypothetical protein
MHHIVCKEEEPVSILRSYINKAASIFPFWAAQSPPPSIKLLPSFTVKLPHQIKEWESNWSQ